MHLSLSIYIYIYTLMYVSIYIYIYREIRSGGSLLRPLACHDHADRDSGLRALFRPSIHRSIDAAL